jgi:hypothetical protein
VALVGPAIDFHRLAGSHTSDIRFFVWSDVLGAMALSRPTILTYTCNVDQLLLDNLEGRNTADTDTGLEWIAGCPDVFTMLMVQIINLCQSRASVSERIVRAERIEEVARAWKIWPKWTRGSAMRVQRMAAQEIWRHTVILYLYNVSAFFNNCRPCMLTGFKGYSQS